MIDNFFVGLRLRARRRATIDVFSTSIGAPGPARIRRSAPYDGVSRASKGRALAVELILRNRSCRRMMRLLADENVSRLIVERHRAAGFYVKSIGATTAGASDNVVLAIATGEGRILMTEDRDFGEMAFRIRRLAR